MKAYELLNRKDGFSVVCNGKILDLDEEVSDPDICEVLDFEDEKAREVYWHTSAHILAQAVLRLFPGTQLGIGPAISEGFYYDFIPPKPFTPEDLIKIEKEMKKIINEDYRIYRKEMKKEESIDFLKESNQNLKIELIDEIEEPLSFYFQNGFSDMCKGPHLRSTGYVKSIKLLSVAAAYWRGDENNTSMQRIYGISFTSDEKLNEYLEMLEEAKKRDHRKIGKKLKIFNLHEKAGAGLIYWHEAGTVVREEIENLWKREHKRRGYNFVITPHIAKSELWNISGHLNYYKENMYLLEDDEYVLKPMNCPEHILIFNSEQRSYKDLPYKMAELGTVYRKERSGVLHGMLRVRGFTQDDAHIFCTPEQLEDEIVGVLDLVLGWINRFGYEKYKVDLSLRDIKFKEKYAGSEESWIKAEKALVAALEKRDMTYRRMEGEAVFYGPKIDFQLTDAIGRTWQGSTIQVDFNLPERFNLKYIGPDGKENMVIMIHRAIMGSVERFVGGLIEHFSGNLPFWLAPEQVRILPITDEQHEFCDKIENILLDSEVRCTVDKRSEKIGFKIRDAEISHIPFMGIIGKREQGSNSVSLRIHSKGDRGSISIDSLLNLCKEKIYDGRKPL